MARSAEDMAESFSGFDPGYGRFTPFRDIWQEVASGLGIETKRMRYDALQGAVRDELAYRGASELLAGELDAARRSGSLSEQDELQLGILQTRAEMADRLRNARDPKLREAGLKAMGEAVTAYQAWAERQEAQAIEAETLRNARDTAGEALRYERDMKLSGELRRDVVTPYQQQMLAFNKAQELLATDDRLGYDFAFTMAIQSLDDSVVREGERMAYVGSSGLTAQAVDLYNKWRGERTPETEAALKRSIAAMHNGVTETYRAAVGTFKSQTEAYGGDWGRVGSVVPELEDWEAPGRAKEPENPTEAKPDNPALQAAAAGVVALDAMPGPVKAAATGAAGAGAAAVLWKNPQVLKALGRAVPGISLAAIGAWLASQDSPLPQREGETAEEYAGRLAEAFLEGEVDTGVPKVLPLFGRDAGAEVRGMQAKRRARGVIQRPVNE